MEDYQIVDLYWARSETAISETERKYGRMLNSISFSLLCSAQDAEECVNDTYVAAWQSMPVERPTYLGAFLSKICRRISVSRYRSEHAQKRGGAVGIIEELSECVPSGESVTENYENGRLAESLNRFLLSLDPKKRAIFVRRYFYSEPIERIASELGMKTGSVKSILSRTRKSLKDMLEEERLL